MRRLLLMALAFTGCFQELDPSADEATRATPVDEGPTTVIEPSAAPIELSLDDATVTTSEPCVKTRQDKTEILTAYCATCHSGPGARGLPPFDFVLDDARLLTESWHRVGQPALPFLVAGDPMRSALYLRATTDMPPRPTDLGSERSPVPSASDLAVLRHWITHCL